MQRVTPERKRWGQAEFRAGIGIGNDLIRLGALCGAPISCLRPVLTLPFPDTARLVKDARAERAAALTSKHRWAYVLAVPSCHARGACAPMCLTESPCSCRALLARQTPSALMLGSVATGACRAHLNSTRPASSPRHCLAPIRLAVVGGHWFEPDQVRRVSERGSSHPTLRQASPRC